MQRPVHRRPVERRFHLARELQDQRVTIPLRHDLHNHGQIGPLRRQGQECRNLPGDIGQKEERRPAIARFGPAVISGVINWG